MPNPANGWWRWFGLGGTVTAGIASALGRNIGDGPYDRFIQIDASINEGNSGGPLFDQRGQVIGMNTAILTPSGGSVCIGFASDMVKRVVTQYVSGSDGGRLRHEKSEPQKRSASIC
jgi:serine protease Do